ncbi:MAG: 4Fe-4S dicluster domain-containing protein [Planctomycetota bacterium]
MEPIDGAKLDPAFKDQVAAEPGGENIKVCFACGSCTAACPIADVDHRYDPRKIIHQVLLGMREQVLRDPVLWHCYLCYTCYARCPQGVKFTNVMEAIRRIGIREGLIPSATESVVAQIDALSRRARVAAVEKACQSIAKGETHTDGKDLLGVLVKATQGLKDQEPKA